MAMSSVCYDPLRSEVYSVPMVGYLAEIFLWDTVIFFSHKCRVVSGPSYLAKTTRNVSTVSERKKKTTES